VDGAQHPLLSGGELDGIMDRWHKIQASFVDEPRRAVSEADALVTELLDRLTQTFAREREQLQAQCGAGDEVSTEDLRQGLRRYRIFFERLLTI
jgi:hypothetical protein